MKGKQHLYWIIPLALIVIGIIIGVILSAPKLSFEEFRARCEQTNGYFTQPYCDSPTNPRCSIENAICDCGHATYTYKNVKKIEEWSGCYIAGDKDQCEISGGTWVGFHNCCCPSGFSWDEYNSQGFDYIIQHPGYECCVIV